MSRCDCCDLPIESCGKEAELRQRWDTQQARAQLRLKGYFPALFDGTCQGCDERFTAGTLIRFTIPDGWTAECCT